MAAAILRHALVTFLTAWKELLRENIINNEPSQQQGNVSCLARPLVSSTNFRFLAEKRTTRSFCFPLRSTTKEKWAARKYEEETTWADKNCHKVSCIHKVSYSYTLRQVYLVHACNMTGDCWHLSPSTEVMRSKLLQSIVVFGFTANLQCSTNSSIAPAILHICGAWFLRNFGISRKQVHSSGDL